MNDSVQSVKKRRRVEDANTMEAMMAKAQRFYEAVMLADPQEVVVVDADTTTTTPTAGLVHINS